MKLGVLFSGGKDSCAALYRAQQHGHDIVCLLSMQSRNPDSFMFHTPNIDLVGLQAECIGVPLLVQKTLGEEEKELDDLFSLIMRAKEQFAIEGIVSGAIGSVYQATRIQKICADLGLWCFNPLWQIDEKEHMKALLREGFELRIGAIAAYPLEKQWLGRKLDDAALQELLHLARTHKINPAGEGGEFESFVTHGPGWNKKIVIADANTQYDNHAGRWVITRAHKEDALAPREEYIAPASAGDSLIISTCAEPLSELEFVLPIAQHIVGPIIHCSQVTQQDIVSAQKIVICGTALMDDAFIREDWSWINSCKKPLLGICAGYQVIALAHGADSYEQREIGVRVVDIGTMYGDVHEAYFIHHKNITLPSNFLSIEHENFPFLLEKENILGVLFHPEVRNTHLLENFENRS